MSQLWAGGADAKMSDEATKGAAKVVSSRLLNLTPLSSRRLKGSRWLRCSREAEFEATGVSSTLLNLTPQGSRWLQCSREAGFEDLSSRLLSCWVLEVVQGSRWLQSSSVFFFTTGGESVHGGTIARR